MRITIAILVMLLMLYVLIWPARSILNNNILIPSMKDNVYTIEQYYCIMASIITVIALVFGILLGWHYFEGRKKFDDEIRVRDLKWDQLRQLEEDLYTYKQSVEKIIMHSITSAEELEEHRNIILEYSERITDRINDQPRIFNFSDEELQSVTNLDSIVQNSEFINDNEFAEYAESDIPSEQRLEYRNAIKKAKRVFRNKYL